MGDRPQNCNGMPRQKLMEPVRRDYRNEQEGKVVDIVVMHWFR
jgi:hypothetical protein